MTWGMKWGSRWGPARTWHPDDQGFELKATPDCVFLAKTSGTDRSALTVDRSQYGDDFFLWSGSIIREDNSFRANIKNNRTVDVLARTDITRSGYLFSTPTAAMRIVSGTTIHVHLNSSLVHTHEIANISATLNYYVISWATEPNPDSTGASNAYRSELRVFNLTEETFECSTWTHEAEGDSADTICFMGRWDTTADSFGGGFRAIRLCKSFHSATETYRTWVTKGSKPSTAGESRLEPPMPTRDSGLGDDGQYAGPVYAMAAHHARKQTLRLWSPIVNEAWVWAHSQYIKSIESRAKLSDPDGSGWSLLLPFLRRRPLPPNCNRLRVRVFIDTDLESGAGDVELRCYSMSQPGWGNRPDTSPSQMVRYYREASSATSDGPRWVDLGNLVPARDNAGYTYLALASFSDARDAKVLAWTVEPVLVVNDDDSLGGFSV